MAPQHETTTEGTNPVSSPTGVKRERSDDKEETRRVLQRTDDDEFSSWTASNDITKHVKNIACSNEKEEIIESMDELKASFRGENQLLERQQLFVRVGGTVTIVAAMEKYPGCRRLQQEGIAVLINISRLNKELQSIVADVGGIHAIVMAMKRFPTAQEIQRLSIIALHHSSFHIQNKLITILEAYGFDDAVGAMNKFPACMDILKFGCQLLFNLSGSEILKKQMRDAKVATTLSAVIDDDEIEEDMQKKAVKAMKALL